MRHGRGMRAIGILTALGSAVILAACGGAASRYAAYMERGRADYAKGDFTHANIEFRNAIQVSPRSADARVLAGRTAERLGRMREAAGLYQSVIEIAPDNVPARASLGRLYLLAGLPDKALGVIAPPLTKSVDNAELLIVRAGARLQQKDLVGGRADAERAVQLAPANEDAIGLLAGLERSEGHPERAIRLLQEGLRRLPDSLALHAILAEVYESAGQSQQAEAQLRRLIALRPGEPGFRYQLASFYGRAGQRDAAQQVLEEAVTALPHSDDVKLALVDFIARERTPAAAEERLRRFIASEPHDQDLRLGLGALLQRSRQGDKAADVYREVIRLDATGPAGLTARDRLAQIYVGQQRYDEAGKLIAQVLEQSAHDNDALFLRGGIALDRGHPRDAIADLRAVLRDQPSWVAAHQALARAYLANGEVTLAEEQLQAAVKIAPADGLVRRQLAELFLQTQRAPQAVTLLEEGVHGNPSDVATRELLVRAYLDAHDLAAAHTAAEDIKTLAPASAAGFFLAGVVAQAEQQPAEAERQFSQALQVQPAAAEPLAALTHLQLARGQSAQAVTRLQGMLDKDPKNQLALELLGEVYLSTRAFPQAINTFERAIALNPQRWQSYRNLAVAKAAARDIPGAVAAYQAGIRAVPSQPQLVVELASYFEKQGRIDEAIALYEEFHLRDPQLALAANNLAMLLATYRTDRTSLDRARDLTVAFASSDDGRLLDTTGWVRFKRGEYQDALPVLKHALERDPGSKLIHYHLALAELQSGQPDDARANLEAALAGSGSFPGADHAREVLTSLKGTG